MSVAPYRHPVFSSATYTPNHSRLYVIVLGHTMYHQMALITALALCLALALPTSAAPSFACQPHTRCVGMLNSDLAGRATLQ